MRITLREEGTDYTTAVKVNSPVAAADAVPEVGESDTETMCVISLNARNNMLAADVVTMGVADASLVHPREVFRAAIVRGAVAIVLVPNHPSGDTIPSAEDIRITRQIVEAGKVVDIRVLDHVIVTWSGGSAPCSMRENGVVQF